MSAAQVISAAMHLDVSGFNSGATKVIEKSKQMAAQVTAAAKGGGIIPIDRRRAAGLASDPAAFMGAEAAQVEMARRRAQTMAAHEVWLAKKNAATAAAAAREKAIYSDVDRHMAKKGARIDLNKEMGFVPMAAGASKLADGADKAAKSTSALGSATKMFAGYLTVSFFQRQALQMVEYGGKINDLSARMGIGTEAVQQWDFALKQNGGTIEDAVRFFDQLAKARRDALEGKGRAADSFQKLGVSKEMLQTGRLEDIGAQVARAFQGGADPQQFLAELRDVGGRGAGEMVTMFSQGFDTLAMEAQNLGNVISSETIKGLDAIGDRMTILGGQMRGVFAPIISWISTRLLDSVSGVISMVVGMKEAISTLFGSVKENPRELIDPVGLLVKSAKSGMDAMLDFKETQDKAISKPETKQISEQFRIAEDSRKEKREADKIAKKMAKEEMETAALMKPSATSLRQMGGFLGDYATAAGPENAAILKQTSLQEKMERHLSKLVQATKGRSTADEEEF